MKNINIAILLFVFYLGYAQARSCCTGTWDSRDPRNFNSVSLTNLCPGDANTCRTQRDDSSDPTSNLGCGNNDTSDPTNVDCNNDNCNCPVGFLNNAPVPSNNIVNNNTTFTDPVFGDMRKIMYPIMGVIFGVLWIILAFVGSALPLAVLLYAVGFIDAIFGIFLIFIPITTFLGLFYMAVGAFTIAITRHRWGGDSGIDFLLALTIIIFLLTGGLTFVSFDWGQGRNYVDQRMGSYIFNCDPDMNISPNDGIRRPLSMRCGNYLYFVTFCVFLLFLVQPIGMIAAAFRREGHHHDVAVVVNEKHTTTANKNTV